MGIIETQVAKFEMDLMRLFPGIGLFDYTDEDGSITIYHNYENLESDTLYEVVNQLYVDCFLEHGIYGMGFSYDYWEQIECKYLANRSFVALDNLKEPGHKAQSLKLLGLPDECYFDDGVNILSAA